MSNMEKWERLSKPPAWALKTIGGGRLKGKTDINPQWRYKAMTEAYGPCGVGWKYKIVRLWNEPAAKGEVFCFAEIEVFTATEGGWSDAIPGSGGHMLIVNEKNGLYSNDEGYKMAVTDALSVALKMLGVASSIYEGGNHESKYSTPVERNVSAEPIDIATITGQQADDLKQIIANSGRDVNKTIADMNRRWKTNWIVLTDITTDKYKTIIDGFKAAA